MTFPKLYPFSGFTIRNGTADSQGIVVKDRVSWTLKPLLQAGLKGFKPITQLGPRSPDYMVERGKAGSDIGAIHQSYDGQSPSTHARYVIPLRGHSQRAKRSRVMAYHSAFLFHRYGFDADRAAMLVALILGGGQP